MTASEMENSRRPSPAKAAQITRYEPANLLIILDNSRNMRRTLELINMFDSDALCRTAVALTK